MDISELLNHAIESSMEEQRDTILPEAIIARLREAAPRYTENCPFSIGDVVMARKGAGLRDRCVGVPALVICVNDTLGHNFQFGDYGSIDYGARVNMRVVSYEPHYDSIVARWVDSADYEAYVDDDARRE